MERPTDDVAGRGTRCLSRLCDSVAKFGINANWNYVGRSRSQRRSTPSTRLERLDVVVGGLDFIGQCVEIVITQDATASSASLSHDSSPKPEGRSS